MGIKTLYNIITRYISYSSYFGIKSHLDNDANNSLGLKVHNNPVLGISWFFSLTPGKLSYLDPKSPL